MLLEVKGLSKQFQRSGRAFSAVCDVDFSMEQGEFVNIIGRSGSGKSTLLNMLTGLLTPTSGTIALGGEEYSALDDRGMSALRNAKLGYIPQDSAVLFNLSVFDNVRLPFYLSKRDGDASGRAAFLLDEVGVGALADSFPSQLSGGELRRVLIARALMNEPSILIADEPTSDLDTQTTEEIMDLFAKINRNGLAILTVTHELDTLSYGSRTMTMRDGRLTESSHVIRTQLQ
ncbi:MAG: ABC transporter ATP-binding protein [Oscillospiraceae bacterium]|jgi:putative ABC transport system ATP-binding protein|nr:ABC transporter ATP-binding protein [Oscillospiraceae bacterium]